MCGSCDYGDMGDVNELFGALYRLNYSVKYENTFTNILKQLRYDACATPNLRKYSTKLDKYTQDWMQQMIGYDIMECRHPGDGPPPYNIDNMTFEQLEEAVEKQEIEDHKRRDEEKENIVPPLFSSYRVHNKQTKLPHFQL